MKLTAVLALAAAAGAATASVNFQSVTVPGTAQHLFGTSPNGGSSAVVAGDTVDAAMTAFGAGGGAFLNGPASHTVGAGPTVLPSGAPGLLPNGGIDTFVSDSGNIRTLTIFMFATPDFLTPVAPGGLAIGGASLESIFFEIPDFNGGPDLFDDPQKVGPASGDFDLIGVDITAPTTPVILFSAAAGVDNFGSSYSVGNGVTTGPGSDIFDAATLGFAITGGQWVISYEIPAPATAGLLGLGGLVALRRRR